MARTHVVYPRILEVGWREQAQKGTADVPHNRDKVQLVCRAAFELGYDVKVESSCLLGFGVDEKAPVLVALGRDELKVPVVLACGSRGRPLFGMRQSPPRLRSAGGGSRRTSTVQVRH